MDKAKDVQTRVLSMIAETRFNGFDGAAVAADLEKNRAVWQSAYMSRRDVGITLRDLAEGTWNVDTLFVLTPREKEKDLVRLARRWKPDSVSWLRDEEAARFLGSSAGTAASSRCGGTDRMLRRSHGNAAW